MPFKKRGATLTAAAAVLAVALSGCAKNPGATGTAGSGADPGGVVAVVNTDSIPQSAFYDELQAYVPRQGQPGDPAGKAVLRGMIENDLVEQLAKKENVAPTDQEIDGFFNGEKAMLDFQTVDGFDKQLQQAGVTADQVKDQQLRPALARLKLLTKNIAITDKDIQDYYDKNKTRYSQPQRVHIRKIALATQMEAQTIAAQIKAGKPFDSFLSQSVDPTPNGDVPQWVPLTAGNNAQLQPLVTALKNVAPGSVSAPLNYGGSWWLVQVVEKKEPATLPLDQIKDIVRVQILSEKAQSNFSASMDLQQKLRQFSSTSTITTPLPQYQSVVDLIKNPPPTPSMPQMMAPPPSGGPRPGPAAPPAGAVKPGKP